MAQKNATSTKEHAQTIAMHGLNRLFWIVIKDLRSSLIVKNRLTGEFGVIGK